jgi:antitoxin YefM
MNDLTIEHIHTYYVIAGNIPVLVHNCGEIDDISRNIADHSNARFNNPGGMGHYVRGTDQRALGHYVDGVINGHVPNVETRYLRGGSSGLLGSRQGRCVIEEGNGGTVFTPKEGRQDCVARTMVVASDPRTWTGAARIGTDQSAAGIRNIAGLAWATAHERPQCFAQVLTASVDQLLGGRMRFKPVCDLGRPMSAGGGPWGTLVTTIVVMTTIPLADAKARLSAVLDEVRDTHDRVVITRNGRPEAVIISVEDLEALEETLDLLSTPRAVEQIRQAEADIVAGEAVDAEELRRLLASRAQRESHG